MFQNAVKKVILREDMLVMICAHEIKLLSQIQQMNCLCIAANFLETYSA